MVTAERYHDISCGHRVAGHESKCQYLHGHNYRIHFVVGSDELDSIGRVMDFSVIKTKLCMWIEDNWDHKFLMWEHDPLLPDLKASTGSSIVVTPFNPTAENMAQYLVEEIGIDQLAGTGCVLIECRVEETRKCLATYKRKI
jgi:6-pyruvoyltetrahydropterin/6-carboxytetrahydropterin synthase